MLKTPSDMIPGIIHNTNYSGKLQIVRYYSSRKVDVKFIDTDCFMTVRSDAIRGGEVKDRLIPFICGIGYMGIGPHRAVNNGARSKVYDSWAAMIKRCYSEHVHSRQPTYKGCTVCKQWHNFQNFAEWCKGKHFSGMSLDKDILVKGNRVYSPETCMFVTKTENTVAAHARDHKFISPTGELVCIYNLRKFCRENNLHHGHMGEVSLGSASHHKGWMIAP